MSLKNRYLLHRSGRNQFGDPGQPQLPRYKASPTERKRDNHLIARHRARNRAFVAKYGVSWLALFDGLSREAAWKQIYPHGRPALSTFRSRAREFASFNDFLVFVLVSQKRAALRTLGHSAAAIDKAMAPFSECGRYFVTYGQSRRTFCSI
jgi:hypothetical protein